MTKGGYILMSYQNKKEFTHFGGNEFRPKRTKKTCQGFLIALLLGWLKFTEILITSEPSNSYKLRVPPDLKSLFAMQNVSAVSSSKSVDISSVPVEHSWFEKSQNGTKVLVVLLRSFTGT